MITYRMLQPEEWGKLDPLVNGQGPVPPPESSVAAVAETEEGEIVGVLFVQLTFHMEPLAISPEHTGKVNFMKLQGLLDDQLGEAPYFAFSESPVVGKMCKMVGMEQLPYRVWFKKGRA